MVERVKTMSRDPAHLFGAVMDGVERPEVFVNEAVPDPNRNVDDQQAEKDLDEQGKADDVVREDVIGQVIPTNG